MDGANLAAVIVNNSLWQDALRIRPATLCDGERRTCRAHWCSGPPALRPLPATSAAALRVGIWASAVAIVGNVYLVAETGTLAAILMVPAVFALGMPFGAAPAAIQEIVPNEMRGQTAAVYLFIVNLIGLGVGPTAVALVTDYVFANDLALRWSMLIVGSAANLIAIAFLAAGLKPYRETLERARAA